MIEPARFAVLAALSGTVALAAWGAAVVGGLGSSGIENTTTLIAKDRTTGGASAVSAHAKSVAASLATAMASVAAVAASHLDSPEPAEERATVSVADVPMVEPDLPETRVQVASAVASDPLKEYPNSAVRPIETPDKCIVLETCID
ncbi:MAG TPA: hypothetical protein VKB96_09725, partial [Gammaproteobacteria bacterium]|nr:hypothetical protein [Gammaproteobacteria bacterium]